MKYLSRFVIDLDEEKIARELSEFGECVLVLRQKGSKLIVTSERTGCLLGEGRMETLKGKGQ
ncbi:hypothetical protein [Thermococcus sp.]|uniref:hypothetical protein n=1 Tax=Thermococcus sp. TaxID=35749 RepID=UPI00260CC852|nr:hypothetical protein [Thermococcus sp.]